MNREGALVLMIVIALAILGWMAWGWRRRRHHDAAPLSTVSTLPAGAHVIADFAGFYVATTPVREPSVRIAAPGLALSSRAHIIVTDAGVALDIPGQDRIVLPADRLTAVGQASYAVDRVVEHDGLVCVTWTADTGVEVDTYLRAQDASASALADAIATITHPSRTGTAA